MYQTPDGTYLYDQDLLARTDTVEALDERLAYRREARAHAISAMEEAHLIWNVALASERRWRTEFQPYLDGCMDEYMYLRDAVGELNEQIDTENAARADLLRAA